VTLSTALIAQLPACWGRLTALATEESCEQFRQLLQRYGLTGEVERLMVVSPFFTEQLGRNLSWVNAQLGTVWLDNRCWQPEDWDSALAKVIGEGAADENSYMRALRCFRSREMLRIVWRDFTDRGCLATTLVDVSALADCVIRSAVIRATSQHRPRFGIPIGAYSKQPQALVVLAMGKLGGAELNLSSDIDLIFCYPEPGVTEGGRTEVSNQEFFIKVGQSVIRYLDAVTADGFVFRVDMRLRPYGDSGALVSNYDALELYYQEQGREWERYALMKARPVTGDAPAIKPLQAMLKAFVYRRYTDFGVIESLRDMKGMIMAEIRRLGLDDNIKKGQGGIREIEFIAQCLQLIHGGRLPVIQVRPTVAALHVLADQQLLDTTMRDELLRAYQWLRDCEHALQGIEDKQTQTLPQDALARERVANALGLDSWLAVTVMLSEQRSIVAQHFGALIEPANVQSAKEQKTLSFNDLGPDSLASLGFAEPEAVWQQLLHFLDSSKIKVIEGEGRRRLERFIPRLCQAVVREASPDEVLQQLLPFVASVSRRSAYLVLLEENPNALAQLISLSAQSPWLAKKLAERPDLLDELLDADTLTRAPDRDDIRALVRQQLLRIPEDDLEAQMLALGRIKDSIVLRVAASELSGSLPIMKVSDYLTFLAETLLEQAIAVAKAELLTRHGEPQGANTGFAVLGYGKLGGIELSYGSDLDVVFVFDGAEGETAGPRVIDNVRFYTRLAQRIVHVLSTQMAAGRLYEVDLRLRPHGDSGLVAVSLAGFTKYQLESAWTWEHQALVRTRAVAGEPQLLERLSELRADILCRERDPDILRQEVVAMRSRMHEQGLHVIAVPDGYFDLKRAAGGIVDIEFVVQYAVLAHASRLPSLSQWSDVVRILESLEKASVMTAAEVSDLRSAYLAMRSAVHRAALADNEAIAKRSDFEYHLCAVSAIRDQWLPGITHGRKND